MEQIGDLYNVGDFTTDNFVITSSEYFYFDDFIFEKHELTKNFNRLSVFQSVNSEYRSWNIPGENESFERIINQKK